MWYSLNNHVIVTHSSDENAISIIKNEKLDTHLFLNFLSKYPCKCICLYVVCLHDLFAPHNYESYDRCTQIKPVIITEVYTITTYSKQSCGEYSGRANCLQAADGLISPNINTNYWNTTNQ